MSYMDIEEFRSLGFLQEANRQFFHPLGLALTVEVGEDGAYRLFGIQDHRDDPEGMIFTDLSTSEDRVRAENVAVEGRKKRSKRIEMLGNTVQPLGHKLDEE